MNVNYAIVSRTITISLLTFSADFTVEKSQEGGLRRKKAPWVNLGPKILKIVVFRARRRLLHLHPHFGRAL
jgi:hypothetical protein